MNERTYVIPLRKEWLKAPKYRRAKKAVAAIKAFLVQHMKAESLSDVSIGMELNKSVWLHGMKNPPSRVTIHAKKEGDRVFAELSDVPFAVKETSKAKGLAGKLAESITGDGKEHKEPAKETPKAAAKPAEKKPEAKPSPAKK